MSNRHTPMEWMFSKSLRFTRLVLVFFVAGSLTSDAAENDESVDLRLTLPPTGYAVAGSEMNLYFDNLVLAEKTDDLSFDVKCDLGMSDKTRWTTTPKDSEVGLHEWQVTVTRGGKMLAQGTMNWMVSPAKLPVDRDVSLLIVGDSLTHSTVYPNDLAKRLTASGLTKWKMLGTHRPKNAEEGVAHEGYGGWTWNRFITHYEPNPDRPNRKHSSPFVFLKDDKPQLDVGRFLHDECHDQQPDFVIFKLGINDCFTANPDDPAALDQRIDTVFQHAETLVKAFREVAPKAQLGICLTTPGNQRESGFEANYKGKYPRWGWKRIQHRLVQRQIKQFGGRASEQIHLIPTELNLDTVAGYPTDNAVHPNQTGYRQIAASIHAWLMSRLAAPRN